MVLELLKMEVREDMRAAIITDIIRPLSPGNKEKQCHPEEPSLAPLQGGLEVFCGLEQTFKTGFSSILK